MARCWRVEKNNIRVGQPSSHNEQILTARRICHRLNKEATKTNNAYEVQEIFRYKSCFNN